MVQIIDEWIADEPLVRHAQILEVVLANCSSVLWPHNPEKLKRAPEWIATLRASLGSKASCLQGGDGACAGTCSFSTRSASSTPQKKGRNGLSVASADVIVVQEHGRENKFRQSHSPLPFATHSPAHPTSPVAGSLSNVVLPKSAKFSSSPLDMLHVDSHSSACSSSNCLHYPEVGAENNRVNGGRPDQLSATILGNSQISQRTTEEYYEEHGVPPTAATTRQGTVVLVTENGSPLLEPNAAMDFSNVPLQVKRLSGGITNELFHVYDEEDVSASVVVRVFGKETDRVISRESELFYQSLFIPTYVHGTNFLIYAFLNGFYTLPYTEMVTEATHIAHAMAEFQVRATCAALRDHSRPLLRDSQNKEYWESFDNKLVDPTRDCSNCNVGVPKGKSRFHHESNYLMDSLTKWVELVLSGEILQKVLEEKQAGFLETAHNLQRECAWMLSVLEKERGFLPEGVCHNDLLSANVMIHSTRKEVRIIDFDYTKRSFLLYDVANHFNEYPGLDCDYDTYFPSDTQMLQFIAEYRKGMRAALKKAWDADTMDNKNLSDEEQEIFPNAKALFWTDSSEAEAEAVAQWTRLAKLLTLASHLSWCVWSLLQEAVSTLDVDFLSYANVRYRRYVDVREECSRDF
ncbi:putative ethanolamine kinase [Leptomonas seymouri]|uniref:ethanolamine kinase n=1 Tax=Leptomonas seymouri TaxID=5684 RepID=A0A0N0P5C8_LEPSE|nr:putative ethanolamine kinase [Leptomonas seymouri]|eukprot:KPI86309.1 putative ethanolamine kinase [Leptomonas seymouri]